jgi:transglutaminase-like putative cysteine protease
VRYQIAHRTQYTYAEAVSLSHNIVRLRPRDSDRQRCLSHELKISPSPRGQSDDIDYFGNHTSYFSLGEAHNRLIIEARSEVEVLSKRPNVMSSGASWEQVRQNLLESAGLQSLLAREFSFDSPYIQRSPGLEAYARPSFTPGRPMLECVFDLTKRIYADFKFLPGSTKVGTPVADVLRTRRGVCQDFAHLQIGCLRSLGLAARYVSGYLDTSPPPGRERVVGADVSHAWLSAYTPDDGWVDFDPTNGLMPSDGHITVAWARDYDDLTPIRGVLVGGRRQKLDVAVDVLPLRAA